jgi:hypothetical protein
LDKKCLQDLRQVATSSMSLQCHYFGGSLKKIEFQKIKLFQIIIFNNLVKLVQTRLKFGKAGTRTSIISFRTRTSIDISSMICPQNSKAWSVYEADKLENIKLLNFVNLKTAIISIIFNIAERSRQTRGIHHKTYYCRIS